VSGILAEAEKRKQKVQQVLLDWASSNLRDFPWRRNRTPYRVLVSEFLLKRTTSTAVKRIYEDFLKLYSNIEKLAKADVKELEKFLETIGYHKLRARAIKETASHIMKESKGKLPTSMEELLSIPNIGPYTAGAILSLGYGQPASMVDSNVERILKRVFKNTLPKKTVLKWLQKVDDILVPKEKHETFNYALLDLGALICTYREHYCAKCPINIFCDTGAS
jgi:A/G-specific adenine glycosylase